MPHGDICQQEKVIAHRLLRYALVLILPLLFCWAAAASAAPAPVTVLALEGAIGPASADYVERGLARASEDGSQLLILKIDTPGGLDSAMRTIIKAILNAPIPVATYVAPGGARAASAGTYILYASHIAAMAPGTNLGAATPVQVGGTPEQSPSEEPAQDDQKKQDEDKTPRPLGDTMTRKQVNDAAAYIRGLAEMRGRNPEWAERSVRESVSLPANEAAKQNVVDLIADDVPALLRQIDGKSFEIAGEKKTLQTADAQLLNYDPDWRVQLLAVITDPSIALLLMTIGIYGLIFEFMNPGIGVAGVLGGICLLLAMYALQLLPVNYAGLALIVLGIGFMIAEAFAPSFGVLGLGGIVAFITGAVILIDTEAPGFGIPLALIIVIALISAVAIVFVVGLAMKTRRRPVQTGGAVLIGEIAEMIDDTQAEGWARLGGETWRVISRSPVQRAQKVRVVARKGLLLEVAPANQVGHDNQEKGE